jgi:hypothetical protein
VWLLVPACVIVLSVGGCGKGTVAPGVAAVVFIDTSGDGESAYAIRGTEVFATVSAPGGGGTQYYSATVPDSIGGPLEHWTTVKGSTTPFRAGEGGFTRVTLPESGKGKSKKTLWRSKDRTAIEWFGTLQRNVATDENKTEDVPSWVKDNAEMMGLLGLST